MDLNSPLVLKSAKKLFIELYFSKNVEVIRLLLY